MSLSKSEMITIKPIAQKDCEDFRSAVDLVARERKYLVFLEAPPLAETEAYVRDNIRDCNPHFIARSGEHIIGWCDIIRKSQAPQQHCGILGIGLLPDYRGRGLGRRLIETTIAQAEHQGMTRIELTVHADNTRAFALYLKCGFRFEGCLEKANLIDGRYIDSIVMAMLLTTEHGLPPSQAKNL